MCESGDNFLKFIPFSSDIEPSFWHKLSQLKLDVDKLEEVEHKIWGIYGNQEPNWYNKFRIDCSSFNATQSEIALIISGTIINKNTIEAFKDCDKISLLNEKGKEFEKILKTEAVDKPYLINTFFILTYSDLKKYHYYYWFCFPAVSHVISSIKYSQNLYNLFNQQEINVLTEGYLKLPGTQKNFFGFLKRNDLFVVKTLKDIFDDKENAEDVFWCFCDPSSDQDYPGWPLRNYLEFLSLKCENIENKTVNIISIKVTLTNTINLSELSKIWTLRIKERCRDIKVSWVGWERNERGKMGPRLANLSQTMDPVRLSEQSVDLNLKLMKWQIVPDLNLDVVRDTKCLLLGAGTLGCGVARNLLSWGVRNITLVDKGNVSYSNPVRQNLFKFEDSVGSGKQKAVTAAVALSQIFPGVVARGITMSIPMPGHPVSKQLLNETTQAINILESLIAEHDVIYLLMDSRESRWLPTVIAAANNKLVINAALGFDSYLVMRHGVCVDGDTKNKLGCYFCNDVTAPGDSGRGRTLDQQCTVTRPGVSCIASGLAVELMVSVLQSPRGGATPADETECNLGIVPHSIRGFLPHFQTLLPTTEAFGCCVACSPKVLSAYRSEGLDFILKVLDSKEYLEELTGLVELHKDLESADILVLSEEDELDDEN